MLILSRKEGQSILIGTDIEVRVMRVKRDGTVSLGIRAPEDVPIWREEIAPEELQESEVGDE